MEEIEVIDKKNKKIDSKKLCIKKDNKNLESQDYLEHIFNRYVCNRFRFSNACTKGRSEIAVTGAKAYKQKGTGNARRGINSTPLRRGGAVAFGPKPRSFAFKLNKKTIKLSQDVVLSKISKKIKVVSNDVSYKKTKEAVSFLNQFKEKKITLLITHEDREFIKAFRNIKDLLIDFVDYFEPEVLLVSDLVLFTENSFKKMERK
tara:strand:+ start:1087 stop:1698 length:612 start_codon:yes stop_codon:yes gene_type:complete